MDKCIKVELPTGHVLLEKKSCEQRGVHYGLLKGDEKSADSISNLISFGDFSIYQYKCMNWLFIEVYKDGAITDYGPFKVIAQYGDEFPV